MKIAIYALSGLAALALILALWLQIVPLSELETLGFLTGVASVWLTVKANIWNWPIGIANSALYLALFFSVRLYADAGLQAIYIILGTLGWYWWLRGGARGGKMLITHVTPITAGVLALLLVAATVGQTLFLERVNDSAPFWDALTTTLSLIAQFMLTRKLLENWYVWITADVIYIVLYIVKGLYLTSVLYAIFFTLCVLGVRQWRVLIRSQSAEPQTPLLEGHANA
jgi:nicotinamide mononucleotide transporter